MAFDFDALNLINNCDEQTQIFTDEVRDVVQGALTGQIFQNPVDSLIQGSKLLIESNSGLSSTIGSALETAGGGVPGGPDLTQAKTSIENLTQILTGDPTNPDSVSFASVLTNAQNFTNRLSGRLIDNEGTVYQLANAVGIATTYNNIVNNLRLPNQDLIDNFTPAFESILPTGGGELFASVQSLNQNITGILGQYTDVSGWANNVNTINEFVTSITDATQAISQSIANVQNLVQSGKDYIDNALALIKRYGLAQLAISSALNDPCFAGELLQNVVGTPELKKSLEIIKQVGVI